MSNRLLRLLTITLALSTLRADVCVPGDPDYAPVECACDARLKPPTYTEEEDMWYDLIDCHNEFQNYPFQGVWGYSMTTLNSRETEYYAYHMRYYADYETYCAAICFNNQIRTPSYFFKFPAPVTTSTDFVLNSQDVLYSYAKKTPEQSVALAAMLENLPFHENRAQWGLPFQKYTLVKWGGPTMTYKGYNFQNGTTQCKMLLTEFYYRTVLPATSPYVFTGMGYPADRYDIYESQVTPEMIPCVIAECQYKIFLANNVPICSNGVLYCKNYAAEFNHTALCDNFEARDGADSIVICHTPEDCQRAGCAYADPCDNQQTVEYPVCGNNYQLYTSAEQYDADVAQNLVSSHFSCGESACTQAYCDKKKCEDSFGDYPFPTGSVCHVDGSLYNSISDFCNNAGYLRADSRLCGPNGDQACSLSDCCQAECNTHGSTDVCNSNDQIESYASYCANKCQNSGYQIKLCYDGNSTPVNCTTCDSPCVAELNALYSSPDSVCGTNNQFYSTKGAYCIEKDVNASLEVRWCANNTPCPDGPSCCFANCKADNPNYEGGCYAGHLDFIHSVDDYCNFKCSNNGVAELVSNDPDQCCNQNCIANNPNYTGGCYVNHLTFIHEPAQFCNFYCANGESVEFVSGDQNECCNQNCLANNPEYPGGCYANHLDFITTGTEFCNYYCLRNEVVELISNDPLECCSEKCLLTENRLDACDPLTFDLANPAIQCVSNCPTANYQYLTCGGSACTQSDCNVKKCVVDEPNSADDHLGVCGSNSTLYSGKQAFCEAKELNSALLYVNFPAGVPHDEYNCKVQACISKNQDTYYARCNNEHLIYHTVQDYCHALALNPTLPILKCDDPYNPGFKIPCNAQQCEVGDCVDDFLPICGNAPEYPLLDDAVTHCQEVVADETYDDNFTHCEGGCTAGDCDKLRCLAAHVERGYCDSNGTFHNNKSLYCDAILADTGLTQAVCNISTGCNTATNCSINHCVNSFNGNFNAVCGLDYIKYETAEDYCRAKNSNPGLSLLMCQDQSGASVPCNLDQCCHHECIGDFQPLCNSASVLVSDADSYCTSYCTDPSIEDTVFHCDGGCSQLDCDRQLCLENNPDHGYCGNNGIFYADNLSYCNDKITDNSIAEINCNGQSCTAQAGCDVAYCIHQEQGGWYARCDTAYNEYDTPETYCEAKHSIAGFADLLCLSGPCTADECCRVECAENDFNSVCGPSPDFSLYNDESEYCGNVCQSSGFDTQVHRCGSEDCVQEDCDEMKCVHDLGHDNVCGSDSQYYTSKDAFCASKRSTGITEVLCNGTECASQNDCCFAACQENNPEESYVPRCNGEFEFLETRDEYCNSVCSETTAHSDLMCDDDFCSKDECCLKECNETTVDFVPVCGPNYEVLTLNLYCDNYCVDNNFTHHACDNGCDESKCENLECNHTLQSVTGSICLSEAYNDQNYFDDLAAYCSAKVDQLDYVYTIGDQVSCSGSNCADDVECCYNRCLEDEQHTTCNRSDFGLLTPHAFCSAKCGFNIPQEALEFERCIDSSGNRIDCTDRMCCMKDLTINDIPEPLCSSTGIVFLTHASYCNHKTHIDTGLDVLVSEDIDFAICASDYTLYSSIYAFCTAKAQNSTLVDTGLCNGSTCNSQSCCTSQCDSTNLLSVIVNLGSGSYTGYPSLCHANCAVANPAVLMTCSAGVSEEDCELQYCMQSKGCDSAEQRYVCASDNMLYPSACEAECRGLTKQFNCASGAEPGNWQYWLCDLNCDISRSD